MKPAQDWIPALNSNENSWTVTIEAIQADSASDSQARLAALSTALRDVLNLFNQADKSPDEKSPVCTGDRREMWESVLKRYGTP
jgi:hypothetical protein